MSHNHLAGTIGRCLYSASTLSLCNNNCYRFFLHLSSLFFLYGSNDLFCCCHLLMTAAATSSIVLYRGENSVHTCVALISSDSWIIYTAFCCFFSSLDILHAEFFSPFSFAPKNPWLLFIIIINALVNFFFVFFFCSLSLSLSLSFILPWVVAGVLVGCVIAVVCALEPSLMWLHRPRDVFTTQKFSVYCTP